MPPSLSGSPPFVGSAAAPAWSSTPESAASDADLLRRARLGVRGGFEGIVHRHGPAIYRFLIQMLHSPADAEEATQETFIAAWRGIAKFRGDSSVQTWLFSIARRKAADQRAKQRKLPVPVTITDTDAARAASAPGTAPGVIAVAETATDDTRYIELIRALQQALKRLPRRQREVWILRENNELSYQEIGQITHQNTTVVRGLLARARTNLAQLMEDWR